MFFKRTTKKKKKKKKKKRVQLLSEAQSHYCTPSGRNAQVKIGGSPLTTQNTCNTRGAKKGRIRKHPAESFLKTYPSVLTSSWLPRNRSRKAAPGGCHIHRRTQYGKLSAYKHRNIQLANNKAAVSLAAVSFLQRTRKDEKSLVRQST